MTQQMYMHSDMDFGVVRNIYYILYITRDHSVQSVVSYSFDFVPDRESLLSCNIIECIRGFSSNPTTLLKLLRAQ